MGTDGAEFNPKTTESRAESRASLSEISGVLRATS